MRRGLAPSPPSATFGCTGASHTLTPRWHDARSRVSWASWSPRPHDASSSATPNSTRPTVSGTPRPIRSSSRATCASSRTSLASQQSTLPPTLTCNPASSLRSLTLGHSAAIPMPPESKVDAAAAAARGDHKISNSSSSPPSAQKRPSIAYLCTAWHAHPACCTVTSSATGSGHPSY